MSYQGPVQYNLHVISGKAYQLQAWVKLLNDNDNTQHIELMVAHKLQNGKSGYSSMVYSIDCLEYNAALKAISTTLYDGVSVNWEEETTLDVTGACNRRQDRTMAEYKRTLQHGFHMPVKF